MRVVMSDIPYTQEDEDFNLQLLQKRDNCTYAQLLEHNTKVISYVSKTFQGFLNFEIPEADLKLYATEGFYLACKGYNFSTSFIDFAVFYMEQYLFYQVYNEYFLIKTPVHNRIRIQKLYSEMLKNLDKGSGLNYFDAISKAAESINMPLDTAINLIAAFMQLSVKNVNECEFAEEVEKMAAWVLDKKPKNINNAPLPFVLVWLEAKMQETEHAECRVPFKSVCEKFDNLVLV